MLDLEVRAVTSHLSEGQVPQQGCFKNWIGRIVTLCPEGYYTNKANLKVKVFFGITGILSFGTLIIGTVWKDSMDDAQKITVSSVGAVGLIGSAVSYVVSSVIFNNQPNNRSFN